MARLDKPIITLTTDFGWQDGYAGALHASILSINPQATIVNLTHNIPSFDIVQGAFVIGTTCPLYPKGTIHVAVIDPGVGSDRLPILIKTKNYFFVGPDNGLFSMVPSVDTVESVYHLKEAKFFRAEVSTTFHGRDIFSPVAAHLSKGITPSRFGPKIKGLSCLDLFDGTHIVAIDKFGNAVTNISRKIFQEKVRKKPFALGVGRRKLTQLVQTYSDVPRDKAALLFGSSGFLELALYQGSIAQKWGLTVGQKVLLKV